jgi:hypothetical protein
MMMNNPQYPFGHTSNDLLFSLEGENARQTLNYTIVAQSLEEVQDIQNAPSISMGPSLIDSGQVQFLTMINIYAQRGEAREQVRLLYMNAVVALGIWKAMGQQPSLIGAQHRPPKRHCWPSAFHSASSAPDLLRSVLQVNQYLRELSMSSCYAPYAPTTCPILMAG